MVRERPLWPYVTLGGLYVGFFAALGWVLTGWLRQRRWAHRIFQRAVGWTASGVWRFERARFALLLAMSVVLWMAPGTGPQILVVALLALGALVWPRALLFVLALTLPFTVLIPAAGRLTLPVSETLAVLLTGSLIAHAYIQQRLPFPRREFSWWAIGLIGIGAVSLLFFALRGL